MVRYGPLRGDARPIPKYRLNPSAIRFHSPIGWSGRALCAARSACSASPGPRIADRIERGTDREYAAWGLRFSEPGDAAPRRSSDHPDPRIRPDRHRAGLRVRLLRHAGVQGPARGGVPGRPRQLEPRDDHDRSGVLGSDLHRADHAGGGREDPRRRRRERGTPIDALLPTLGGQTALELRVPAARSKACSTGSASR